jgi:hypothetical protein
MDRALTPYIKRDSDKKIVLLSGPRQSGKTTLTKQLYKNFDYLNYDASEDRQAILEKHWRRDADCILFDELHKMTDWKRWLKGVYDTEGNRPRLIVTGSANLDTFRKVGDSLAGRYFSFRLHPLDIEEGVKFWQNKPIDVFNRIMECSGFPEPFLEGNVTFYRRWQKTHLDIILRQDFLDLYAVRSIKSIQLLLDLLKPRIGSTTSYATLAQDLQADPKSVGQWLELLENMYALFRITPYHKNIARSLIKEPKFYFYDVARSPDKGAKLENLVACALLKRLQFLEDIEGVKTNLHYLRTKDGEEIDFLVLINDHPTLCIEVKSSDDSPSKSFSTFKKYIGDVKCVQLVLNLKREFDSPTGVQVRSLVPYLANLSETLI